MKNREVRKIFNIDSWLKTCIKRTFDFYREYSFSHVNNIIQTGELFKVTTKQNQTIGRIEVVEINTGLDTLSENIIDYIIKTFNEKHGLENRKDLDTLIYDFGKNDFSCRLVCKFYFANESISQTLHRVELLLPISPNILSPSLIGNIDKYKKSKKLSCILSDNKEVNTISNKQTDYLRSISTDFSYLLVSERI